MAFGTVVNEYGFERGLDTRDFGFVDIAFALFLASVFDIEIDEFLSVYNGNAQFFCLRCVE